MPTGLQAALLALVRVLEAFRDEQLTGREYLYPLTSREDVDAAPTPGCAGGAPLAWLGRPRARA
jgi:hypothetical protein